MPYSAILTQSQNEEESDWRIDFMQSRYRDLMDILDNTLDNETFIEILNKLGAKCGEDLANKYRNDPEGFFAFIKSHWVESVYYDKEKGIITVWENLWNKGYCS